MKKSNKNKRITTFLASSLVGLIISFWCMHLYAFQLVSPFPTNKTKISATGLKPEVLRLALTAYNNAKNSGVGSKEYLTIVDYSLPSSKPRLWVINMQNFKVEYHTYVAHGIGSGDNKAERFSNRPGSGMSSLGIYVTGDIYKGRYGDSLNIHGLEDGFNSNAFQRRVVFHPAEYVGEHVIKKIGRLGRSLGCLALNGQVAKGIMHTIKGGSYVFCYYPDATWLSKSKFLADSL